MVLRMMKDIKRYISAMCQQRRLRVVIGIQGALLLVLLAFTGCAKMGNPDGGWYDETPPHIIGSTPHDKGVGVKSRKVSIYFNEFIKVDNPTENVVVSPPQIEMPEIKGAGKRIVIELKDSLKPNTTYTIDFSNAISDNNENNPLGNFTYSFSTGDVIDTMEVSGYVLESENLEPIKGILVGLYNNLTDTIFKHEPLLRVSRTDSRGHFVIKGIAPGKYRAYALQDVDGNYFYNQKSEKIAFSHDIIVPSCKPDVRQDTVWRDSLHIDSMIEVPYTHYMPDNIVLRAFTEEQTDRFLVKSERVDPDHFSFYFSSGSKTLPKVKGLNFNSDNAFIVDATEKKDTVSYWLRDTALVNQDSLKIQLQYETTDSAGNLVLQTDTLDMLAKIPYERRMKDKAAKLEKWKKKQERAEKRGGTPEKAMKGEFLEPKYMVPSSMSPDKNVTIMMPVPLANADTSKIHLYSKHDSLWYKVPYVFRQKLFHNVPPGAVLDSAALSNCDIRTYTLMAEWREGVEYSLEIDSAAFRDFAGRVSMAYKTGIQVKSNDSFGSLFVNLQGFNNKPVVVQLLDNGDRVVKEVYTSNGTAEFYYVEEGSFYMRMYVDRNNNHRWDTGNYEENQQAEEVYYYPGTIVCKQKWDLTQDWNPLDTDIAKQKPLAITKQKPEKDKTIKRRNMQRAKKLGIQYLPKNI
jgi:hypothetical protein